VSFDAQVEAWQDASRLAGDKWGKVFGEVIPAVQAGLARHLGLPDPNSIAFAPNTHDFVRRLLSALPPGRPYLLTSNAEFHSFRRQIARLEEDGLLVVDRIPAEPFATFPERFRKAAARGGYDLVFVSQVFFSSGATAGDLAALAAAVPEPTLVAIDGYHGFLARPTDLSACAGRAFYLAGGYKYAMAGENACFLHVPPGHAPRPRDTGWYAEFSALTAPPGKSVGYSLDGSRFLGATFDPTGLYRMCAVLAWLEREGITAAMIHAHATALMTCFLERVEALGLPDLSRASLITPFGTGAEHGNFVTFATERAGAIEETLSNIGVQSDHRGERLRFGFGIALNEGDVDAAVERMRRAGLQHQ
jgi:kynureninase